MTAKVTSIINSIDEINTEKEEIILAVDNISKITKATEATSSTAQGQFATVEEIKYYSDELGKLAETLKCGSKYFQIDINRKLT